MPDELTFGVLKERLSLSDAIAAKAVLIDGFPRTEAQARLLLGSYHVERLILVETPENTCVKRAADRCQDPLTGTIYNMRFMPPPTPEIASRLVRRNLDSDENHVHLRIRAFTKLLGAILPHFRGKIQLLNGAQPIDDMVAEAISLIRTPIEEAQAQASLSTPIAAAPGATLGPPPAEKCVVCLDNTADFLVVPCGHKCGCKECLEHVKSSNGLCPICRNRIQSLVQVFNSGVIGEDDDAGAPGTTAPAPGALDGAILEQLAKLQVMSPPSYFFFVCFFLSFCLSD